MIVGIFKSNQGIVNVFTVILLIVLWGINEFYGTQLDVVNGLSVGNFWIDFFLGILLVAFQAIFLTMIVNEYKLTNDTTHLPSLFLILLYSIELFENGFNQILLSNTLTLIALYQLFKLYNVKTKITYLFNAGILIGIATLLYPPNIVYFLFIWIVLIYIATPVWRDFVVSLIGFVLPITYFLVYSFVTEDLYTWNALIEKLPFYSIDYLGFNFWEKLLILILALLLLVAGVGLLKVMQRSVTRTRRMLWVIVIYGLIAIATMLFNRFDYLVSIQMTFIPVALVLAIFFQNIKKQWLSELVFLCVLGLVVIGYFS